METSCFVSLPSVSFLVLMSHLPGKQKSQRGLTYLVTHIATGSQLSEVCRTLSGRGGEDEGRG